jgi:hypothetical protein
VGEARPESRQLDDRDKLVIAMDKHAQTILDEARETLHRIRDVKVEHRDHSGEYWERRPEPKPAPIPQPRSLTDAEAQRWQTYIDNAIAAAFEARAWRDDARRDAIADFVADVRKQLRAEFQEQLGSLRADVTIQKAAERRDHDGGEVVDMIEPMERKRRA